jgi:hypothetical protein
MFPELVSSSFEVNFGAPQGSVLGPLLFDVFINDLCDAINYFKYPFYADDTKICHAINPLKIVVHYSLIMILYKVGALLCEILY